MYEDTLESFHCFIQGLLQWGIVGFPIDALGIVLGAIQRLQRRSKRFDLVTEKGIHVQIDVVLLYSPLFAFRIAFALLDI
jgi:hypothetical protein